MKRRKKLWVSPLGAGIVVGLLLLGVLMLAGCAQPVAIAAVPPTATVYPPLPTETPKAAPSPTPVPVVFPLAAPTKEPVDPARLDDQACVDCHKDEAKLKETAKEEVVVESLSEGEG